MHESIDQLINWLNDAAGMEESIIQVLSNHVKDFKNYPSIQQQVQMHLDQTKHHAEMVRDCVKQLGGSPSTMKQAVSKVQGLFTSLGTGPAGDELVKNVLSDYAAEHFEIACYTSLIDACHAVGETNIVSVLEQILEEDKQAALNLLQAIPVVTDDYIVQKGHEKAA